MRDLVRDRILALPSKAAQKLAPIPWPDGLAPVSGPASDSPTTAPLPRADVVVWCWTEAESYALADVLTPGRHASSWSRYDRSWDEYDPQLTRRSPALDSHSLLSYQASEIAGWSVLCLKSSLHLATDGPSVPLRQLYRQVVQEVEPRLLIDTGTAGGIGSVQVGDVVVTGSVRFDCNGVFRAEPWAHEGFQSQFRPSTAQQERLIFAGDELIPLNARRIVRAKQASRLPIVYQDGDVLTCDQFAFDDAEDTYGLRTYDPEARVEEMDVAVLGLASQDLGGIDWLTCRTASDPQIPHLATIEAEKALASRIYDRFGYTTQIGSALCAWALIAAA